MKHIVIGTAGHVDHGKTWLTRALTGVNTDRLEEEQRRGITLDLGFAQLKLSDGQTASIVDVPGHEKLVRNMIVGATGIDVVLLVIAADEGFMPQTQEHLDILELLAVERGIIVFTKCDLVDEEWLDMVSVDVLERVSGTFLAGAPIMRVSSKTGAGVLELKRRISELVATVRPRPTDRAFRLPVDRVFTMKGHGTVVTGTLVDGIVRPDDAVTVYPSARTVKIRELQNHNVSVDEAVAGMRVAANLAGIDRHELSRGCTLAKAGSMLMASTADASIRLARDSPYNVRNSSQLHFYLGTQELVAKVRLLDCDMLKAGESCFAQLAFKQDLTARNQDRFILRFFSPVVTVGGGTILQMGGARLRRNDAGALARLGRLAGTPDERVEQLVRDRGAATASRSDLIEGSGLSPRRLDAATARLETAASITRVGDRLILTDTLAEIADRARAALESYHGAHTLERGMHLDELRELVCPGDARTADGILAHLAAKSEVRIFAGFAALPDFKPSFTPEQLRMRDEIEAIFSGGGFEALLNAEVAERFADRRELFASVFAHMLRDGALVALTSERTVHRSVYDRALAVLLRMFSEASSVKIGDYRTELGVSRKFAQLYLDHFDACRISRLVGDARQLLAPATSERELVGTES